MKVHCHPTPRHAGHRYAGAAPAPVRSVTVPARTTGAAPPLSFVARARTSSCYSSARTWLEWLAVTSDRATTLGLCTRVSAVVDRLQAVFAASTPPIEISDRELLAVVELALRDGGFEVGVRGGHLACNLRSSALNQRVLEFAFYCGEYMPIDAQGARE